MPTTTSTKMERSQVHAAVLLVHIPASTEDVSVGCISTPNAAVGSAEGGLRALQQVPRISVASGKRDGGNVGFFLVRRQERSTGRKGCTNPQLIHDAPRLRYTAYTRALLSCLGAAAAARGPSGTTATAPLLSLSPARGQGATSQWHQPSHRHGVCHTHHTPAKTRHGYKLDRFSDCGAFCSSLHLWTISPPLKCFTLFITFHLTPATSSK